MIDRLDARDAIEQAECSGGRPVEPTLSSPPDAAGDDRGASRAVPAAHDSSTTPAADPVARCAASTVADSSRGRSALPPGSFFDYYDDDPGDCSEALRSAFRDAADAIPPIVTGQGPTMRGHTPSASWLTEHELYERDGDPRADDADWLAVAGVAMLGVALVGVIAACCVVVFRLAK